MFSRIKSSISIFNKAFGAYKLQVFVLVILGFVGGLLGGIGINVLIPIFSFIVNPEAEMMDPISKLIKNSFLYLDIDFSLKYLLIFCVIIFVVKAIVLIIFSYVTIRIISGYEKKTRTELFNIVLKSKWSHLLRQRLGHLETILIKNVENSQNLFSQVSSGIMTVTNIIVYTTVAVTISLKITLITFGLGGFTFLFLKPLMRKLRDMAKEQEEINRDVSHHINESVLGMKTVKIFSVGEKVAKIAEIYFERIKSLKIRNNTINNLFGIFIEPMSVIFIAFVFAFSYKTSGFNFAALITVVYLIKSIFIFVNQLQTLVIGVSVTMPYLRTLIKYEEEAREEKENIEGTKPFVFENKITVDSLSFFYEENKFVLNGINFEIKKGEMVGVIGPSGAGKTTLVDIMLRLFHPKMGKIFVDNVSAEEINLEDWRKNISYVSQDIFLTNDSIKNNIRFYNESVSDKDIEDAVKMADVSDFVNDLPKGIDSSVGERGVLLSGGQRQRIAIARALARKPKLLILDEATSALDNESENKIQNVIKNLKGKITVLVIAHRLSTISGSDKLVAIENGNIRDYGAPSDLLKDKESYYSKVYNLKR